MFTGSMVAMVTPMHDDGSVDWSALEGLVNHHVAEGTDAIVSVGTTGESATLNHDEHGEVIARTVKAAAGRIPVIGGTGANSTAEAISLTRHAAEVGVDACLLVVALAVHDNEREVRHQRRDDVRGRITDAIRGLCQLG